jgi:integrase
MGVRVREWDGGKGGTKAWWIFINHQGRRKAKRVGTGAEGRRAAVLLAEKLTARMALDDFDIKVEERVTLARFAEGWIERYVAHNLRPTTAKKYAEVLRVHWLPAIGAVALQDLTRQHIRLTVQRWQANGLKHSTLRWFLNVLQSCLEAAVEDELIDANPAAKSTKWVLRTKGPQAPVDIFTAPEIKHLLRRATAAGVETYTMVMVLARTGLRISELLGLRAEDLDLGRREIHVRRTWGNFARGPEYYGIPKSGEPRIVDMSLQLREALHAWLGGRQEGWLFPGPKGVPATPNHFYYRHWKPLFDHPAVAYRHPHVLRHTYASHLLVQGEAPAYVKEQLGHSSIKITVDVDGHWIRSPDKRAVDGLDDAIASAASIRKSDASTESTGLRVIKGGRA